MEPAIRMFLAGIEESIDGIFKALEGVDDEGLHWKPLATANSLAIIAKHSLANAERNVLAHFAGQPYDYNRDAEFITGTETAASLSADWARLKERMHRTLEAMPVESLDAICEHVRLGKVPGRAVLFQGARHAAEHDGEASLTRDLLNQRG